MLNGRAFSWSLLPKDQESIRFGLSTLLKLGLAAGARRAVVPRPGVELELTPQNIERFDRLLSDRELRVRDFFLSAAHPQGGNPMASAVSPHAAHRVLDDEFRVIGYENLFVTNASIFPTSITVNPQWTVMAMSSLTS